MRRLRDDHVNLTRRGTERPAARRGLRATFALLLLVSAALVVLSRIDHPALRELRWRVADAWTPMMSATVAAMAPVRALAKRFAEQAASGAEVERLAAENRRLATEAGRVAALERQLADLSALARVVPQREGPFVSGRVVATSNGALARTATIDAGRLDGVRIGYPVVNGDGVVGRVLETGGAGARVLLLSDLASRVPAIVGRQGTLAVVAGDGSPRPRLEVVADGSGITEGDGVATSGIGGLFPRGLPLGRAVRDGDRWRIEPHARLDALEFVAVMIHPTPLGDLDREAAAAERAQGGGRPGRGGTP